MSTRKKSMFRFFEKYFQKSFFFCSTRKSEAERGSRRSPGRRFTAGASSTIRLSPSIFSHDIRSYSRSPSQSQVDRVDIIAKKRYGGIGRFESSRHALTVFCTQLEIQDSYRAGAHRNRFRIIRRVHLKHLEV